MYDNILAILFIVVASVILRCPLVRDQIIGKEGRRVSSMRKQICREQSSPRSNNELSLYSDEEEEQMNRDRALNYMESGPTNTWE